MIVDIIGGGALGLLFAGRLLAGGEAGVRLWTRTEEQAEKIRTEGFEAVELSGQRSRYEGVDAFPLPLAPARLRRHGLEAGMIWLFVKQTHIGPELLSVLAEMPRQPGATLVCFQNGVGHAEALAGVWPSPSLAVAVTTEAAAREGMNRIRHTGSGATWIGPAAAEEDARSHALNFSCVSAKNLLEKAGIEAFVSNNIEDMVYQKLLVNAVINPLTALLRVKNGELLDGAERMELMRDLLAEAAGVYHAAGIPVNEEEAWKRIMDVCRLTAGNTSSMLQDILAGRPTECEAITGAIIRLGARYGAGTPLHQTIYRLIRAGEPRHR
ncbi:ketopantoate reductase family protein [Paenibacillus dendritiformis]|uniref:ketopantoate reductase family protein n=1 Tax=Paenibacillus dendritiformis TaxID=130049 RepID=UPI00387E0422